MWPSTYVLSDHMAYPLSIQTLFILLISPFRTFKSSALHLSAFFVLLPFVYRESQIRALSLGSRKLEQIQGRLNADKVAYFDT